MQPTEEFEEDEDRKETCAAQSDSKHELGNLSGVSGRASMAPLQFSERKPACCLQPTLDREAVTHNRLSSKAKREPKLLEAVDLWERNQKLFISVLDEGLLDFPGSVLDLHLGQLGHEGGASLGSGNRKNGVEHSR